jgi:phosphoribosylglycinamide formyltransferase-1
MRVGVLASGAGSNLQAILDAGAQVAVVISNVASAQALSRAEAAGVPSVFLPHKQFASRDEYDAALLAALRKHGVELVCLAGFMRLIGPVLLGAFENKILNIHPALLPSFPGMHAVRQALDAGVRISGCTVHVVDQGTDSGPIVAQAAVPVLDGDSEETLAARILKQEHRLYPRVIRLFEQNRVVIEGRRVRVRAAPGDATRAIASPLLHDDERGA